MNRLILLCTFFLLLPISTACRIGCLAKSRELTEPFDTKAFHLVSCSCDCDYYAARGLYAPARNQCLSCYHSHDPSPTILVKKIVKIAMETPRYTIQEAPRALQQLINRYHRHLHPSIFDK